MNDTPTASTPAVDSEPTATAFATGPLAGIVVVDLGRVLAAPYCTMLLADLGATVIKVEGPAGDETRQWQPPTYKGQATYYLSINRNKFDIQLDLRDDEDVRVLRRLLARADVLVDNFKPNGLAKLGFGPEQLARDFPQLIQASVTGFGEESGASLPGYDLLVQAASGHMHLTGAPDTPPFRAGTAMFDVAAGLHTCIGILAALFGRTHTGRGQRLTTNLLSAALSSMVNQTGATAIAGESPIRMGNEHPSIFPYAPFATSDGHIVITVGNDRQFQLLCKLLGTPELATDDRFAQAAARIRNRDELRPLLAEVFATRTTREWFDFLSPAGIPCGPINDVPGGLEFAKSLGLNPVVTCGQPEQQLPTVRNPVNYSGFDVSYRLAPPAIDEHRQLILDWLDQPDQTKPLTPASNN